MSHKWYMVMLIILALATRFTYFGFPDQTVFDEVHFGKFVSAYYTHEYYYDIHPPLGKLIIAGFAGFFGYNPDFNFEQIGDRFPDKTYMALRFLPSLAGAFLPLVMYFIARRLSLKNSVAFAVGLFVIFENAILTQSRFILMDSFLYLFGFLSLLFYLRYKQNPSGKISNLLLFSILCAFTGLIKWTGLTFLAIAGLFELYDTFRHQNYKNIVKVVIFFAAIPFLIYFAVFALHFYLLPNSGPGDAYMEPGFQKTLKGNFYENDESVAKMNLEQKFVDLNRQMYLGNKRLTATHPYGSQWYTWPLMSRPIFYWTNSDSRIYYFGNPLLWWISTIAVVMFLVGYFTTKEDRNRVATMLLIGYILNLLPFIGIKRVMFLYHYGVALLFALLILGYLINREGAYKRIAISILVISIIAFLYFSPLSYGFPLSPGEYQNRNWFSSWI